ncbi:integrase family protein [Stutzerimonas degradans]|jgi:integrase|nr:integrase family protein [Stutzerimonas degradans]EKM97830.1 integrase family protein [Stutzerimonas degradans]
MKHEDFTRLAQVYARWLDGESANELRHIGAGMQSTA